MQEQHGTRSKSGRAFNPAEAEIPPRPARPPASNPNRAARRRLKARVDEIERGLRLYCKSGNVIEIRALNCGTGRFTFTTAGYFDHEHIPDAVRLVSALDAGGIYVTLNPVRPALLARAENRLVERPAATTSNADIERRAAIFIDFDAKRPSGIASTDAEHAAALARAQAVRKYLVVDRGWPAPLVVDSGNGAQDVFPTNLPNDKATADLIRRLLQSLDLRFSDESVTIDVSVFNASRIIRLPGSVNRKGDDTESRPHRLCRILDDPQLRPDEGVTLEQVQAEAALYPEEPKPDHQRRNGKHSDFNLTNWLATHNVPVGLAPGTAGRDGSSTTGPIARSVAHMMPAAASFSGLHHVP